jgi:hypothetical protein
MITLGLVFAGGLVAGLLLSAGSLFALATYGEKRVADRRPNQRPRKVPVGT